MLAYTIHGFKCKKIKARWKHKLKFKINSVGTQKTWLNSSIMFLHKLFAIFEFMTLLTCYMILI